MKKPSDWETAQAFTGEGYPQLPRGGYVLKIKAAHVQQLGNSEQLILLFDIAEGEHKDYYQGRYEYDKKNSNNPNNIKWKGILRQRTTMYDGTANGYFKGLINAIEKSNNFTFDFDEKSLIGKLVGGLFAMHEFELNGNVYSTIEMMQARSVDAIRSGEYTLPKDKLLDDKSKNNTAAAYTAPDDVNEEDLPF